MKEFYKVSSLFSPVYSLMNMEGFPFYFLSLKSQTGHPAICTITISLSKLFLSESHLNPQSLWQEVLLDPPIG